MTNNFKKLAVAIAGAILSLGVIEARPAQADIITYDFSVSANGNNYGGFFSYDDSATEPRNRFFPYFDVTEFNFNFLGKTYTKSDLQYDGRTPFADLPLRFTGAQIIRDEFGRPAYIPKGGTLTSFGFGNLVRNVAPPGAVGFLLYGAPGTTNSFLYVPPGSTNPSLGNSVTTTLRTPTPVPEPDSDLEMLGGLGIVGLGWFLRKKITSSKSA